MLKKIGNCLKKSETFLGLKFMDFARNLAEIHRNSKNRKSETCQNRKGLKKSETWPWPLALVPGPYPWPLAPGPWSQGPLAPGPWLLALSPRLAPGWPSPWPRPWHWPWPWRWQRLGTKGQEPWTRGCISINSDRISTNPSEVSDFRQKVFDFRCHVYDFPSQVSDVRGQMSDVPSFRFFKIPSFRISPNY